MGNSHGGVLRDTAGQPLFDVYAVNIDTGKRCLLAKRKHTAVPRRLLNPPSSNADRKRISM